MDQLRKIFDKLSLKQRISLGAVIVCVLAGIWGFTRWQHEQSFKPLFSNLAPEDGSQILNRLREHGVEYRLENNGTTISVPADKAHELRMELAGEGLPKSGRIGFELFDKNNLGITDFQEQVNYHRALEGELERSMLSLGEVENARVHLTFAKDSVFLESRQPAKASVVVKLKPGSTLTPASIQAITHLTASAVEGLAPDQVSVIDARGNLLNRPRRSINADGSEPDDTQLEFRQKVERDLLAKASATLEDILGPGKFRVSVSADVDFTSGEQSEETFDPTKSVMASQQRSEDTSNAGSNAGTPGTASNLPRPTSRPDGGGKNVSRRTENTTYQSTRMVKKLRLPQGSLRRISLAVLVDQSLRWEGTGAKAKRVLEAPPPETLKKITDLVSAAVGLQSQRGDQIIVDSLPFDATLRIAPPEGPQTQAPAATKTPVALPAWIPAPVRSLQGLGGIAAGVVVILAGAVMFFLRKKKKKLAVAEAAKELPAHSSDPAGEHHEEVMKSLEDRMAEQEARKRLMENEALQALRLPELSTQKADVLVKHLTETANKDPESIAQLLRNWLQEDSVAR